MQPIIIDLHTHLLPDLDDGALDWDESIKMAKMAVNEGITHLAVTPHHQERIYSTSPAIVTRKVEEFRQHLAYHGINLNIISGMEVHLTPELPLEVEKNAVLTLNNTRRYLLIELPFSGWPLQTEDILFQVQLHGITPILAHPERNKVVQDNPKQLVALVERGMFIQVNTGSLTGAYGSRCQKTAEHMVMLGLVHVLGSDAHSPLKRPPEIRMALNRIASLKGIAFAERVAAAQDIPDLLGDG